MMKSGLLAFLLLAACGHGDHDHENEVITTIRLTFTPPAGAPVVAVWDDPDGDGGAPPTIDAIALAASTTYALTIAFENGLESPPEDITQEIRDEGEDHQLFFTGDAPLAVTYADTDRNGLPIGLTTMVAASAGTGDFIVTLRHMPPRDGQPVKTATSADQVATGGITAVGGDTDATGTFAVTVQ
jgi:hypothetical protein